MKKKINKIMYILIIIMMFMQNISGIVKAATEISKANLKNDHKITTNIQYKNVDGTWHDIICNYICYTNDGKKYPAYCIKHGVHGVDEEGAYTVQISKLLSDNRIWRTIINGYPYKTPEQLGVETADDAYVATKQAINSVVLNRDVKSYYKGINDKGKKIVNAIYNLSQIGKNGTQIMQEANLKVSQIKSLTKYDDEYYYQEYKVTSDVSINNYSVNSIRGFPNGSYVTDTSGDKKKDFKSGQNFRVVIPKNKIFSDFAGIVDISGKCKTYPIFFGEAPSNKLQDYAITYDSYGDFKSTGKFAQKVNNAGIAVLKQDEESLKPIEGVKFQLTTLDGKVVDCKTTNLDGEIIFDKLYPGNYILQEISTNDNYIVDNTKHEIELGYDELITKRMTNKHKKGNLKIIKVDKDDNNVTLGAIEFDLINEKGEIISHLSTDADGEAYIENINIGNYVLRETKTKKEYNLCIDEDITVKWNETSEIVIENEKKKGQIKVIKEDKDNNQIKLSGVEFEVLDKNNRIIEKVVTDEKGEAITSRLPIGEYKVKETSLGKNTEYILNDEIYTINVENNEIHNLHVTNEHKKGKLKIIKVDKDNNSIPLENIEFEIIDEDGFKYNTITDKNGIAEISDIRTGKVIIRETKTKQDYVLLKEKYYTEIKFNKTSEITIENEKKKGQLEVYKTDQENSAIKLQGVEFEILDSNNNVVDKIITDKNGYAITKKIPIGEYYLRETKTDKRYVLNDEIIKLQIKEDEISTLNITNKKIKGKINIVKISSKDSPILNIKKGEALSNVIFEIYDSENNLVDTLKTDEKGQASSKELEIGRYKVKEVSTLEHYILNTNEFFVNIENNNEIKILKVENEPAIPGLNIEKTGQEEAHKNEEIKYDFDIRNTGNVELNNFTWIEYIPYEQVQVTKMITGIYNLNLNYKIYCKTNKKDYKLFKEVNTNKSEYLDFGNINLSEGEKITELKMEYGTVPEGFKTIVNPSILVKINNRIKIDDTIINKTDLTGNSNGYEVKDTSSYKTKIKEIKIEKKLPRTGC